MNNLTNVLIVEDESAIRILISTALETNGYNFEMATNGSMALSLLVKHQFDIILLDLGSPDLDGIDIIKKLRTFSFTPIIVISARSNDDDKITALDMGADDYLTKPFSLAILRARIDAVLRTIPLTQDKILTYEDIKIDLKESKVYFKANQIDLTSLEYEILVLFIKNPHRVYTRSQLLEMFWEDRDKFVNDNTLTSTIKRIREKLDKEVISTVRGIGYRMD